MNLINNNVEVADPVGSSSRQRAQSVSWRHVFRHSPDCLIVQVTVMPYVKWSYQFRVQFRLLKV